MHKQNCSSYHCSINLVVYMYFTSKYNNVFEIGVPGPALLISILVTRLDGSGHDYR